ncbi:hypothetical protein I7I50_04778 [Histoplasma capsulatum G186AR]|uniref:Uncharacterized protein n=1 Tax=Ajellomyces capsulatus TaxID=5037 RepID=A0A8H8CY79_AJECA|nr:hypothetical protein I7I52_05687 [Histoplasma capsulatum]QSS75593.1 hypothetical protein I7I50_04778 [Histoplasma capsulatum G186AR]
MTSCTPFSRLICLPAKLSCRLLVRWARASLVSSGWSTDQGRSSVSLHSHHRRLGVLHCCTYSDLLILPYFPLHTDSEVVYTPTILRSRDLPWVPQTGASLPIQTNLVHEVWI